MTWPQVSLAQVAPAKYSDFVFSGDDHVWHLGLEHIESQTGRVLIKKMAPASEAGSSTYVFDERNVLYSKLRPYLNKVVCPSEPGIATTELIPLRPKQDLLDRRFLTFYLRSRQFMQFAEQCVAGVKMPRVIMDKFWQCAIPLPSLSEQRRIVEILDQADALRKKRAEADAKAQRIIPSLFHHMFGDTTTNPKGIKKEKLGKLLVLKSGEFLPAKHMDPTGTFPVYGGNGINGYHSKYMFEHPVIILGRVGAYCGVVHHAEQNCWVTDNALYVANYSDKLNPYYLVEALRLANLNQYAGRAGQPLISGSRLYPVEILVPTLFEQDKFSSALRDLKKIELCRNRTVQLVETTFSVLLHRAFTGELTATWREAHLKELLSEMEIQSKVLSQGGAGGEYR